MSDQSPPAPVKENAKKSEAQFRYSLLKAMIRLGYAEPDVTLEYLSEAVKGFKISEFTKFHQQVIESMLPGDIVQKPNITQAEFMEMMKDRKLPRLSRDHIDDGVSVVKIAKFVDKYANNTEFIECIIAVTNSKKATKYEEEP